MAYALKRTANPAILWLIAAASLAASPHVLHLPVWICALFVAAVAGRWLASAGMRWWRVLGAGAALLGLLGVYITFGTLLGRDAGVALLVLLLGLKVFETQSMRDAVVAIFLSYFVVITNFFYTQSIPTVLYLCAAVVLITTVLIRLNAGPRPLALRSTFALAAKMLLQAVPLMVVLFALFPRISAPLWTLSQTGHSGVTGLSDTMAPGQISRLIQSDDIAFRVIFDDQAPSAEQRYWRGPVLSRFDGSTWRSAPARAALERPLGDTSKQSSYVVSLEPHHKHWLFALDVPTTVPKGAVLDANYQLLAVRPVQARKRYRTTSATRYRIDTTLSGKQRRQALQLPAGIGARARGLARQWRADHGDEHSLVARALRYFNEQPFTYTLTPPVLNHDPTDEFLFETRAGFCEHFAGSFVVLMRAAGIPARVVTGYQGGEWNALGNYLLVRQADAHAWAEVWIKGRGWLRVDPTAAVSPARIERGISNALAADTPLPLFVGASYSNHWLNKMRLLWDNLNFQWDKWVVAFGPEKQRALLHHLGFDHPDWRLMISLMMISLGVLVVIYAGLAGWRNRPPRKDPIVALYEQFGRRMATVGLGPEPSEGPSDYAQRLRRLRPDIARQVKAITSLYADIRYGPCPHPHALAAMKQRIKALRLKG